MIPFLKCENKMNIKEVSEYANNFLIIDCRQHVQLIQGKNGRKLERIMACDVSNMYCRLYYCFFAHLVRAISALIGNATKESQD
jgi:hypothetical protein